MGRVNIYYSKKSLGHSSPRSSKSLQKLRQFIGMINFYRDMWQTRSELLAPLTALTSKNVWYEWKDKHQKFWMLSNMW